MARGDARGSRSSGATRASSGRTRSRSTAARLEAPRIFINVGGRADAARLGPASTASPVLTNTSMMALDTLPEHLIVVGGSYIGLEFAQMYRRFGSQRHGARIRRPADRARRPARCRARCRRSSSARASSFISACASAGWRRRGPTSASRLTSAAKWARDHDGSHLLAAVGRQPEHRRPRPRRSRHRHRHTRLHHRRRRAAHQRAGRLGAR